MLRKSNNGVLFFEKEVLKKENRLIQEDDTRITEGRIEEIIYYICVGGVNSTSVNEDSGGYQFKWNNSINLRFPHFLPFSK